MSERFQFDSIARALALGLPAGMGALVAPPAMADLVKNLPTSSLSLDTGANGISIDNVSGVPNSFNDISSAGTVTTIPRFAPSLGVLTGVAHTLVTTKLESTLSITGKAINAGKANNQVTASGVLGVTNISFVNAHAHITCLVPGLASCTATKSLLALPPGSYVTDNSIPSELDGYAGETGTILAQPFANLGVFSDDIGNAVTATLTARWAGTLDTSYSYLSHAIPSFSHTAKASNEALTSLTLDFGTLQQGAREKLSWSIFNGDNLNNVGLDLDSISTSSVDADKFFTGLTAQNLFTGLTRGASKQFTADIDTSQNGIFSANYVLHLSDADVGAPSTLFNYDLNLTLKATVVPLPAGWVVMASGLGLLGWSARKKAESGQRS